MEDDFHTQEKSFFPTYILGKPQRPQKRSQGVTCRLWSYFFSEPIPQHILCVCKPLLVVHGFGSRIGGASLKIIGTTPGGTLSPICLNQSFLILRNREKKEKKWGWDPQPDCVLHGGENTSSGRPETLIALEPLQHAVVSAWFESVFVSWSLLI